MGMCDRCTAAIQSLWARKRQNPKTQRIEIFVTLPKYHESFIQNCWLCRKLAQWLEINYLALFGAWRRKSVEVELCLPTSVYGPVVQNCHLLSTLDVLILPKGWESKVSDSTVYDPFLLTKIGLLNASEFDTSVHSKSLNLRERSFDADLFRKWIHDCTRNHVKCRVEAKQIWYPSRLLDVGTASGKVRLIISEQNIPKSPYMTLSHRWGSQIYSKLTSATLAQYQEFVDVMSLPQIFQDTIHIAHLLGIRYLWIDALCIKQDQDDLSDWEIESREMKRVYSGSILNVSATLSKDGSESLLSQAPWGHLFPSGIELECDGHLHRYYAFDGNSWKDEIDKGPLNQRGWVFQERFLAPRVLHFGEFQMGWECSELEASEIFPSGFPITPSNPARSTKSVAKLMSSRIKSTAPKELMQKHEDIEFIRQRQGLVRAYSECALTFPSDKLIAFDGVGRSITLPGPYLYVAGMWEYGLIHDLTWWRLSEDREGFPIAETLSRAPSWSWASVDGRIMFSTANKKITYAFADVKGFSNIGMGDGGDLGRSSSLSMVGLCFSITIEFVNQHEEYIAAGFELLGHNFSLLELYSRDDHLDIHYEIPHRELQNLGRQGTVAFMPLFVAENEIPENETVAVKKYDYICGLLLTSIPGSDSFRRLGVVGMSSRRRTNLKSLASIRGLLDIFQRNHIKDLINAIKKEKNSKRLVKIV